MTLYCECLLILWETKDQRTWKLPIARSAWVDLGVPTENLAQTLWFWKPMISNKMNRISMIPLSDPREIVDEYVIDVMNRNQSVLLLQDVMYNLCWHIVAQSSWENWRTNPQGCNGTHGRHSGFDNDQPSKLQNWTQELKIFAENLQMSSGIELMRWAVAAKSLYHSTIIILVGLQIVICLIQ